MKKTILLSMFFLTQVAYGQTSLFKSLRFDEDYSGYAKDTTADWYHKLKFAPLSKNRQNFVSIGGEVRTQYFHYKNPDWGDAANDLDGFVLSRYLLHGDLHVGKYFRSFAQLQSSLSSGEAETPSPVNQNPFELHQAFFEGILTFKDGSLAIRIGRQELSYGSQRLVSLRDAPNNRQSFDGLKFLLKTKQIKTDIFYSTYVQARPGIYDDKYSNGTKLWGVYLSTEKFLLPGKFDLYYLGFERENSKFDDVVGLEKRHSIGARNAFSWRGFEYDAEGLYQFGRIAKNNINAWTISANLSYRLSLLSLKPKIGVKSELISGDRRYGDGKLNSFNPLFPRGGYFGLAAMIGPSNLFDVHPYLELSLSKKLLLTQDYDIFKRLEKSDGIYAVNGKLIYSGKGTNDRNIGSQLGTSLEFTPTGFLYLRGEFTWFDSGSYLKKVSAGKDIFMYGLTATLKF